jgi:hypothetical protein
VSPLGVAHDLGEQLARLPQSGRHQQD